MSAPSRAFTNRLIGTLDAGSPWAAFEAHAKLAIAILTRDFRLVRVNPTWAAYEAQGQDHYLGKRLFELYPQPQIEALFRQVVDTGIPYFHDARADERSPSPRRGSAYWDWSLAPAAAEDFDVQCYVLVMQDVTARIRAEERARLSDVTLGSLLGRLPGAIYRTSADQVADQFYNTESLTGYGAAEIELLPEKWRSLIYPDDLPAVLAASIAPPETWQRVLIYRIVDKAGICHWVEDRWTTSIGDDGRAVSTGIVMELPAGESRFRHLFSSMTTGFALCEIILDEGGQPCDFRFLEANPAFAAISGLPADGIRGYTARQLMPDLDARWIARYGIVARSGDGQQFEDYSSELRRHYRVTAFSPTPGQFALLIDDITLLKCADASSRRADLPDD